MSCLSGTTCSQMALSARSSRPSSHSGQRKKYGINSNIKKRNPEVVLIFKNMDKNKMDFEMFWSVSCLAD